MPARTKSLDIELGGERNLEESEVNQDGQKGLVCCRSVCQV